MKRALLAMAALSLVAISCHSGGGGSSPAPTGTPSPTPTPGASVLEHHNGGNRRGVYVVPAMTEAAAAGLTLDASFAPVTTGNTYAQALFLADPAGHDLVFVATEMNHIAAYWASNGSVAWERTLPPPMSLANLPCGNIDPLGITGTPAIDPVSRTIYFDAMTDAGGGVAAHQIYALSVDDGQTRAGWPVDANTAISAGGTAFSSDVQNQRSALTILAGKVYVAYGGHYGDCGNYHGWVTGIALGDPTDVSSWKARDPGIAIWAPGGIANDGTSLYIATGNGFGGPTWADSEALMRLGPGPVFSQDPVDYMVPADWQTLDAQDVDLGGSGPVLVDMPDGVRQLVVGLGKDGKIYLADRTNMGGIGGELLAQPVSSGEIINAAASYRTAMGTYVVFKGPAGAGCPNSSDDLVAVRITSTTPPSAEIAWCAQQGGEGSPMVTQTQIDGGDTIVWGVGAEGSLRLFGFDGDTGAVVFAGGGAAEQLGALRRFITPIVARDRIIIAGDDKVYAFKLP